MSRSGLVVRYREFLRLPDVAVLVGVVLLARMHIGMVGLAMLLHLRETLGSYAPAGSLCGVYFVAMALAAPIQGRLVDRSGPRRLVLVTMVVQPAALAVLLVLARQGAGMPALGAAAAVAGAFATPIAALTRSVWHQRFSGEAELRQAFAIDSVLIEANYTLGPAVVAAVMSAAGAAAAFGLAIAWSLLGPMVFLASPAPRYFRPEPQARRHLLGPLTEPRLLLVLAATFGLGLYLGVLEVGYPAHAGSLGAPALGGLFLSACSLGSAVMGLAFGGLALRSPIERQFALAAGLTVLPLMLQVAVDAALPTAAIALLAGAATAPSLACQSVLVSRLARPQYATEAFTWSSTCIMTGVGAGMALAGWLVENRGGKLPFVAGAATMAAVALAALALPGWGGQRASPPNR